MTCVAVVPAEKRGLVWGPIDLVQCLEDRKGLMLWGRKRRKRGEIEDFFTI